MIPIHLELRGPIVPYVRMTQRGKYVRDDAQRYLASQEAVKLQLQAAMSAGAYEIVPPKTCMSVQIEFDNITHRSDIDNWAKAILDAANGIVYPDDRWIDELHVSRGCGEGNTILIEVAILG